MTRARLSGQGFRGVAVGGLISLLACAGACGDDGGKGGTAGTTGSSGRGGGGAGTGGGGAGTGGGGAGTGGGGAAGTGAGGTGGMSGSGGGSGGTAGGAGGTAGAAGRGGGGGGGGGGGTAGSAGTAGGGGAGGTAGGGGAAGGAGAGGSGGTAGGAGAGGSGGTAGGAGAGGSGGTAGGAGAGGSGGTAGGAGGATTLNEMESNDTFATANDFAAIAVDGRVSATIGVAGDADFFSVTVASGVTALYVTTFSSGVDLNCASANTNVVLIASDGTTQVATNNDISATQRCSHVSYVPSAGTYFVRVTGNSATATFPYVLAVRAEALPAATPETEPNDDGAIAIGNGMSTFEGNDFSAAAANGPFSADTVVAGALNPAGDEDVFAIRNAGTSPAEVYLETFNGGFGACASNLDTQIRVRDAAGTVLAFDDDAGTARFCSFLATVVPAGATVYAHVIDFGDNTAAPAYSLHISFP